MKYLFFVLMFAVCFSQKSSLIFFQEKKDFEKGKMENLYVTKQGVVSLTPGSELLEKTDELVAWKIFKAESGVFLGTGHDGKIIYFPDKGEMRVIETSAQEVTSIVKGPSGALFVGTGPKGIIYRITENNSKAEVVVVLEEDFIWDLAFQGDSLYAATGNGAGVYKINPVTGESELFFSSAEDNIVRIVWTEDGLVAGTTGQGLVYRIRDKLDYEVIYDAGGKEISDIQVSDGYMYISTSGRKLEFTSLNNKKTSFFINALIEIDRDGQIVELARIKNDSISSIYLKSTDELYFGTSENGNIYHVNLENEDVTLQYQIPNANIVDFSAYGSDVFFCTGAHGSIYRMALDYFSEGSFTSMVKDTGQRAIWGSVDYYLYAGSRTNVLIYTRTGNREFPDETWSNWQRVDAKKIVSPAARFIQMKVVLTGGEKSSPMISDLRLSYSHRNKRPRITQFSVGAVGKSKDKVKVNANEILVSWSAVDPNRDKLTYSIYAKPENGVWGVLEEKIKESHLILNRNLFVNGYYQFKLEVSDQPDNQRGQALTSSMISRKYPMDNLPPNIQSTEIIDGQVSFIATDGISSIKSVHYSQDQEDFYQAVPQDLVYDDKRERFSIALDEGVAGPLIIRVEDSAGNKKYESVEIKR